MAGEIVIAGTDEEQLLSDAMAKLRLPREAIDYTIEPEKDEELLPGAKPRLNMRVRVRPEYLAERAIAHLHAIFEILEIEAEITFEMLNTMVFVRISSEDAASLLIGRDGQNLDALQYLVNRMLLRGGREAPMVVIDVEDYRKRQFDALERLGQRAADRARETGNEIELDPMPALERKYLHHFLRTIDGVRTFSRGDEPERYLVILAD